MSDNVTLNAGTGGATLATDDVGGVQYQVVKLDLGADGLASPVSGTVPVSDGSGSLTVDNAGTFAVQAAQSGTWTVTGTGGTFPVTDSAGSLTVDAPVGTPVFVRLSDGAAAITTLPVSLASVPSHAVTNAGTFAVQVDGSALTALQLIDDPVFADDAAFTVGTSKVSAAGFIADETATDSVDEGDVGAARMTLDRKQHVVAAIESNELRASGTAVTPKFAIIDAATSGDNTLVAAVASRKIRVHSLFLVAAGTVNVRFESGAGGTALTGQMNLVANTGFVLPFNPAGWFETATNTLLNCELSGAVSVDGALQYSEIP